MVLYIYIDRDILKFNHNVQPTCHKLSLEMAEYDKDKASLTLSPWDSATPDPLVRLNLFQWLPHVSGLLQLRLQIFLKPSKGPQTPTGSSQTLCAL